jgi:hypothetical protein
MTPGTFVRVKAGCINAFKVGWVLRTEGERIRVVFCPIRTFGGAAWKTAAELEVLAALPPRPPIVNWTGQPLMSR